MKRRRQLKSTESRAARSGYQTPTKPRGELALEQIKTMEDIFGPARVVAPTRKVTYGGPREEKAWVPGITPAPGEQPPKELTGPTRDGRITLRRFLFPQLPAAFTAWEIRKLPVEDLKNRYIKVLSATMGNHSIALFYCCWEQDQFEAVLDAAFKKRIRQTKAQLADRASFIMHQAMGLVTVEDGITTPASPQATSAMAKVVEKLNERGEQEETGKGFKLIVEGLERNKTGLPAVSQAESIPQRDG